MPERPHESVCIAVVDAIVSMGMADDGGVDRHELECTALRREEFAKAALTRYNQDHPAPAGDGETYNAIGDGLLLLASDAVTWMVKHGHLVEVGSERVRLGKSLKVNGSSYSPGSAREEDLFHSIRRVTPKRLELIRQSMEELGDLSEFFPVLRDVEGNVVDGRHRLAIDENWPAMRVEVPMDMRVAVAVAANRNNAWSAEDWRRLLHHREQSLGRRHAVRVIARLALLEDAQRSDREIARVTGIDKGVIGRVRAELEVSDSISHQPTLKTGRPRFTEEDNERIRRMLTQGYPSKAIEQSVGCSKGKVDEQRRVLQDRQKRDNQTLTPEPTEPASEQVSKPVSVNQTLTPQCAHCEIHCPQ